MEGESHFWIKSFSGKKIHMKKFIYMRFFHDQEFRDHDESIIKAQSTVMDRETSIKNVSNPSVFR